MSRISSSRSNAAGNASGRGKEHVFKVIVVGDLATGKTSLIKRYVHNVFTSNYRATIGVDFAIKLIPLGKNTVVRLQLWDIAGQERFGNMTRVFYRDSVAGIVVYDITRPMTFEAVTKWKKDIDAKVHLLDRNEPIPCVLFANKCDLGSSDVSDEELDKFCQDHGFIGWFKTSAKEATNVETGISQLVKVTMEKLGIEVSGDNENDDSTNPNDSDSAATSSSDQGKEGVVDLNAKPGKSEKKSGCC